MTATFLGVLDLSLRTFTTTYVSLNAGGWGWMNCALQPIDFGINLDLANGAIPGFGCTVFDFVTGATKFSYGNTGAITATANSNGICWQRTNGNNGRLSGWLFPPTQLQPYQFSDNVTLGVAKLNSPFSVAAHLILPTGVSNTAAPEPFVGSNYIDVNGLNFGSYRVNLVPFSAYLNPASLQVTSGFAWNMAIGTNSEVNSAIPYNGMNYLFMRDSTGGTPTATVYVTPDFRNLQSSFVPGLANPPGASIDLNAYIRAVATNSPTSTYRGFLWLNKNPLTITGHATMNGFGILMTPDGSGYYLINFVPTDATAANWQTTAGDVQGKFDDTGILWVKQVVSPSVIFSTTPIPKYAYPMYPPIGVPAPQNDSNIAIRSYRGQSQ